MHTKHLPTCTIALPCRILVVDDDPFCRALLGEVLASRKYIVTEADSGAAALEALRCQSFDLVLLDKCMPGLDGDAVCRHIRGELGLSMLPILMVTASADMADLTQSLEAGANDFLRKPFDPVELLARIDASVCRKRLTDQLDSAESMLFALARMVEAKDRTTGDHCTRLSHAGVVLGRALGLGADQLMALRRGGVMHDIGKLGIPDSILLKPGPLTEAEWAIMRQHVVIGARMVSGLKSMSLTVPIIACHHERWDGSGYPKGLRGQEIPLLARIFQMVDIYDALSHARPYKPALSQQEVVAVLQDEAARGWRDPELTAVFLDILQNRPQDLDVPPHAHDDLGVDLLNDIRSTGALDWGVKSGLHA